MGFFLHLSTELTEEEKLLKKKYDHLRILKNRLKTPKPQPPTKKPSKRPLEPKPDAKEVVKKLLQSGAISAIKVANKETQGFKRTKASERKRNSYGRPSTSITDCQLFSTSSTLNDPISVGSSDSVFPARNSPRPFAKRLHESFVSSGSLQDEIKENRSRHIQHREQRSDWQEKPRQGNTVYVRGYGMTQELLQNTFESIGNIVNITMKLHKNCGFVTFEKTHQAEQAINEYNGTVHNDIRLHVSLARRQICITSLED